MASAADRRTGMATFAADLASTGEFWPDHTLDTTTDVRWLAMDVRNYDCSYASAAGRTNASNAGT